MSGNTTSQHLTAAPAAFSVMLKPRGPICNLDCSYCYYLAKESLYPGSRFRMADDLLAEYTRQYLAAHNGQPVTFAWQGGEPTLMGLDFFRRAVALQREFAPPGQEITNALQTNGTLLTDEWCAFLKEEEFLVGLSLDGPREIHDLYRVTKGGQPTYDRVIEAIKLVQRHAVEFNILCTVHNANEKHGGRVYRFFRDEIGTEFIQFIPIVERQAGTETVGPHSVSPAGWGTFLIEVFDEWVKSDVGCVFVQLFDVALAAWAGERPGLCVHEEVCGYGLAMEHSGDVYSCDHFVEPQYRLGNLRELPLLDMATSAAQRAFGNAKQDTLPAQCRRCTVRFVCHGGCPKDRSLVTSTGESGLNYLCEGYLSFFRYIDRPMKMMAEALRNGRPASDVMSLLRLEELNLRAHAQALGRNATCPCGSGRKVKQCHGR